MLEGAEGRDEEEVQRADQHLDVQRNEPYLNAERLIRTAMNLLKIAQFSIFTTIESLSDCQSEGFAQLLRRHRVGRGVSLAFPAPLPSLGFLSLSVSPFLSPPRSTEYV